MSFIEVSLPRRPRTVWPRVEVLETRECLSVAAPAGLTLTALSSSQVKVAWTDGVGENGYRVYRWDGANTILVSQLAANSTAFTVGNLPANQTQWFTVEAFDAATTARAAWKAISTLPQSIAAPTNLHVLGATQTQVALQWGFAAGATGYRVYGWNGTNSVLLSTLAANVNAFTVSNLTPGSAYYFRVQSFNATNTASTAWVTALTGANSITAPTNLTATAVNASTLGLSWTDSLGETGYRVYRWNGVSGVSPVLIATLHANVTGYQAIGLLPGKTYWFYVEAFNTLSSANSAWAQGTTPVALPLQPPTQVTAVANTYASVIVSWTEPAREVGYRVFVWTGAMWALARTVPAGTHQVTIGNLETNRTHWFLVQSYTDNNAEVSYSSAVSVNL